MEIITSIAGGLIKRSAAYKHFRNILSTIIAVLFLGFGVQKAQADLQFDVFFGYDGYVREAGWFPIMFEIFNDGPSFNATIEISSGNMNADQVRRVPVELPTNTRKRVMIPMFSSGGRFVQWNAQLVDERGKVRDEKPNITFKSLAWEGYLLAGLPRTFAGMPSFPELNRNIRPELKPEVARMQVEQVPDSPIAFESLDAFYLNSEKALSLTVNQASALLAWIHSGGHLIVSIEQLADISGTPWLQQLLPCNLSDIVNVQVDKELQSWLQRDSSENSLARATLSPSRRQNRFTGGGGRNYSNLTVDPAFTPAQMPVAVGTVTDGEVVLSSGDKPLIVQAKRGRGAVTLLTFNPEREPFRSWKNKGWFWSKLVNVPENWYHGPDMQTYGGTSLDGVFGALIDSRQVQKLPVKWLLLLLVVYLIVIGPLDQYWLKKIGKQMLTWITFPTYVVLFSLLIYFIGYKLRAGETEWNELHVVDVLPRGGNRAELRGRSYASVYSSANAKYKLAFSPPSQDVADQTFATLRGELTDLHGTKESSRAQVEQYGNSFRADIAVPVWSSLLYVNDWMQPGNLPLRAEVVNGGGNWQVVVENLLDRPVKDARIVIKGLIYELGEIPAGAKKNFNLDQGSGNNLQSFIQQHGSQFQSKVDNRKQALGESRLGQLDQPSLNSMVASFAAYVQNNHMRGFVTPPGMDLTPLVERGDVIFLGWTENFSFTNPINQFNPPRSQRNTLLRLSFPITAPSRT